MSSSDINVMVRPIRSSPSLVEEMLLYNRELSTPLPSRSTTPRALTPGPVLSRSSSTTLKSRSSTPRPPTPKPYSVTPKINAKRQLRRHETILNVMNESNQSIASDATTVTSLDVGEEQEEQQAPSSDSRRSCTLSPAVRSLSFTSQSSSGQSWASVSSATQFFNPPSLPADAPASGLFPTDGFSSFTSNATGSASSEGRSITTQDFFPDGYGHSLPDVQTSESELSTSSDTHTQPSNSQLIRDIFDSWEQSIASGNPNYLDTGSHLELFGPMNWPSTVDTIPQPSLPTSGPSTNANQQPRSLLETRNDHSLIITPHTEEEMQLDAMARLMPRFTPAHHELLYRLGGRVVSVQSRESLIDMFLSAVDDTSGIAHDDTQYAFSWPRSAQLAAIFHPQARAYRGGFMIHDLAPYVEGDLIQDYELGEWESRYLDVNGQWHDML